MSDTPALFDNPDCWANQPLEAFASWLLAPDFVITKQGVVQPLRPSSAAVYRYMGNKFIREVILSHPGTEGEGARDTRSWSEVSASDIHSFLVGNNLQRGIRNRYVRLLERLFDHLAIMKLVNENPARGLAIKEPSKSNQDHEETMWLTPTQEEAAFEHLPDGKGWKAQRNRALIATVLGGGLKVSEIIALKPAHVGDRQGDGGLYIEVPQIGAGRRHRTKVAPYAALILSTWLRQREEFKLQGDLLFPAKTIGGMIHPSTVYRQVAAVLTAAGIDAELIKRRGARTLRNTYAVRELEAGQPLELVGEYLGHRTDRSTQYYQEQLKPKA